MTDEEKSFKVSDRRRFASGAQETQGEDAGKQKREEEPEEETRNDTSEHGEAEKKKESDEKKQGAETFQERRLPAIDFSTFILSLNSSALVQLGLIDDPVSGEKTKDLELAKQTIDILGMLDEKTKGNLDNDESMMLKNILYDLRMMYVREKQ